MPNFIDLVVTSEKAKGPGSRGGDFHVNEHGKVVYGKKPVGKQDPGDLVKPAATDVSKPQQVMNAISNAIRTGKNPAGKLLDPKEINKLKTLGAMLKAKMPSKKEIVTRQITERAAAHMPFTVFKDAKGQWRWIGVSSSAARDADGETVSLKALEADTATKDVTGNYGPLNWWHTPIKLGTCDFNTMDGPLLVESGTFVSEKVASWVSKAINGGLFKPGMSLEFEHNEPGLPVQPGRVFTKINKVGRALLPAEKASNLLTSFQVYNSNSNSNSNSALAGKEVNIKEKQMIPEEKLRLLEQFVPKEFLDGLLSGNELAIKSAELAGLSFKSMSPAVVETPVAVAEVAPVQAQVEVVPAPEPAPVVAAATVVEPIATAAVVEAPAAPEEVDGEGEGFDTEAIFSDLISRIKTEILAVLPAQTQQPVASKEVTDLLAAQTIALKENTSALNAVVAENKSLKERLDALEGNQPAGIRARVTQGQGLSAAELPTAYKELVDPAKKEQDPYVTIASQLGLIPAPRG